MSENSLNITSKFRYLVGLVISCVSHFVAILQTFSQTNLLNPFFIARRQIRAAFSFVSNMGLLVYPRWADPDLLTLTTPSVLLMTKVISSVPLLNRKRVRTLSGNLFAVILLCIAFAVVIFTCVLFTSDPTSFRHPSNPTGVVSILFFFT